MKTNTLRSKIVPTMCAAVLTAFSASAQQVDVWTSGSGTDTNWSNPANWSLSASPGPGTNVVFGPATAVFSLTPPNNVVDQSFTIGSLTYTNNTSADDVTFIANGAVLTVTNGLTNGVIGNFAGDTVIQGAARLSLTTGGNVLIDAAGSTTAKSALLDLSGLNTFTVTNVNRILVGVVAGAPFNANNQEGMLFLAKTNIIALTGTGTHSTNGLLVGWNANASVNNALLLGQTNTIFADSIGIGSFKSSGFMNYQSGLINPGSYFRGKDGVSRVLYWGVGDVLDTPNAGSGCFGTNDFTGGTVDALIDKMDVGVGTIGTGGASGTGVLTFGAGNMDVNIITNGWSVNTGGSSASAGTINVNGGTLKVNSLLVMGQTAGAGTASSTLNVTGATVDVNTLKKGTGNVTANVSLSGAVFNLTNTAGTVTAPLSSFSIANSTMTLSALASGTNISVQTLTASTAPNTSNIASVPPIFSFPAQFHLIGYTSSAGDLTTFVLGTVPSASPNYQGFISNNVAGGSIDLVLTAGPQAANPPPAPKADTWNGTPTANWDTNTANWISGGLPAIYTNVTTTGTGDFVTFDDSLKGTTNVNLTTVLSPTTLTVNNTLSNYLFTGVGSISGPAALVKQGAGSLTLAESGGDTFNGGILISDFGGSVLLDNTNGASPLGGDTSIGTNAVLQVGNNDARGAIPIGAITNNGTLILSRSDSTLNLASVISGSGGLVVNGSGSVTLSVIESYTGPTTVNNGTLITAAQNQANSGIATSSGLTINNGGTVMVAVDNSLSGTAGKLPITINAGGTLTGLASLNGGEGASSHLAGVLTLNGGTLTDGGTQLIGNNGTWDLDGGLVVPGGPVTSTINCLDVIPRQSGGTIFNITNGSTPSGVDLNVTGTFISGTGSGMADSGINMNGNGTMALAGSNGFSHGLTINGGVVRLNNSNAVRNTTVTLNVDNAVQFGTNIGTFVMGGLSGANSFALSDTGGGAVALQVGQNNQSTGFSGILSGNGSLTKIGIGILALGGTNLYTGVTTINDGTLQLLEPASLSLSPVITMIAPTAVLDPSGRADQTEAVGNAQVLRGNGTINGILTNAGTVSPGLGATTGTLTANNNVILLGTTIMKIDKTNGTNDLLSTVGGTMSYGGTLVITNLSAALATNDSFQLFSAVSGFSGAFSAIIPATPGSGLAWDTNSLAINGTLNVVAGAVTGPTASANITSAKMVGTNLVIHGTNNNVPNTSFRFAVLTSTNLLTPLSNWTPVATNPFNGNGTFDYTNPIVPGVPRQFIDVEAVP